MDEPAYEADQQTDAPRTSPPKSNAGTTPKRSSLPSSIRKPKSTTASSLKNTSIPSSRPNAGATLSKPPSRPTASSTFMKPTASSTSAAGAHKSRGSISSTDENQKSAGLGDENVSKPALGAPKRLSTTAGTTTSRLGTERKHAIQPTANSDKKPMGRASTLSPPKSILPPNVGSRPIIKSHTSSFRAAGVPDSKKRLSTIPDSPAVKQAAHPELGKAGARQSIPEQSKAKDLTRPSLGTRQSTRSAVIQQSVREYELVNDMLQAAMAAEDAGDDVQKENLTTEVDEVITRLKANLEVSEEAPTDDKSTMLQESTESISLLREQLDGSQATVNALKQELEDLRKEMARSRESQNEDATGASTLVGSAQAAHAAEFEELKKEHELAVSSLHQKLHDLELSQQERAEQALKDLDDAKMTALEAGDVKTTQALEKQKTLHAEAVDALESALALERKSMKDSADKVSLLDREIEQHKATLATVTTEAGEREKSMKAYRGQLAEKEQEHQRQGEEFEDLREKITAIERAKNKELETLRQSSSKQTAELKEHVAALKSETDRSSEESAASKVQIQEEVKRQEEENLKLNQVIERLQDEVQRAHELKSTALDENLSQARQDHDQLVTTLKAEHQISVDGLAKSHNAVVEKLASEAQNTRTAHERQTQVLRDEKLDVQKRLEKDITQLESSQEETDRRMQEIEAKHAESIRGAEEKTAAAEKSLADSQRLVKEAEELTEQATSSMVKELEEKVGALENESVKHEAAMSNAQSDMAAAQQQVESLKQVLETTEKDSQDKEEHHKKNLGKVIAEAEAASKALSEYSSNLESVESNHTNAMKDLRAQHETEVQRLRKDLTQNHEQVFQDLKIKHDTLSTIHSDFEKQSREEAEKLRAEHERALAEASDMINNLKQTHVGEKDEVKLQAANEKQEASRQLEQDFSNKFSESEKAHMTALENLRGTHEETLTNLRAELGAANQQSAATAKGSHEKDVSDLRAEIEEQQAELAKTKLEAQKASDVSENADFVKLRADLQKSNDDLAVSQSEVANFASEVTTLKERLAKDHEAITTMERSATESRDAHAGTSREIYMLKEQLDGALQEAETQRVDSDAAKKELQESGEKVKDLTARIDELDAKLQDRNEKLDTEPKISTPTTGRRRHRNKGSKNSPRTSQNKGMGAHDEGETTASPGQGRGGENVAASVQGTMASIQEQVRQLDEVNEEMLEGHARMATMLSNVPDSPVPSLS